MTDNIKSKERFIHAMGYDRLDMVSAMYYTYGRSYTNGILETGDFSKVIDHAYRLILADQTSDKVIEGN